MHSEQSQSHKKKQIYCLTLFSLLRITPAPTLHLRKAVDIFNIHVFSATIPTALSTAQGRTPNDMREFRP